MSMNKNLGWVFYRKAFDVPNKNWYIIKYEVADKNEKKDRDKFTKDILLELTKDVKFSTETVWGNHVGPLKIPECKDKIELVTTYPGLLLGSGYGHEADLFGELKLGFFFDHTTGLPIIPGSSVKGVLRSVFPNCAASGKNERREFLKWLILDEINKKIESTIKAGNSDEDKLVKQAKKFDVNIKLDDIEYEIFEGSHWDNKVKKYKTDTAMSVRDTFYDAYILKSEHMRPDGERGHFLGNDFITPHKHTDRSKAHLDPFSNPTPIQFLKVLPEVTFIFQFKLHKGIIDAEQKLLLFKEILLTLGIGAKTNVGYGHFKE